MVDDLEGHTHIYIYIHTWLSIDILIYIYIHTYEICPSITNQASICLLSFELIWPSGTQLVASPRTRFQRWLRWQHGQVRRSSSPQPTFPPFPRCAWKWIPRQANGIVAIMTWRHPCIRCRPSYRVQLGQIVEENRSVWFSIWNKGPPRQCFPHSWLVYLPVDAPDDCCLKPKGERKRAVSDRAQLGTGTTTEWLECYGGGVARCAEGAVKILQEKGDRCLVKTMICIYVFIYIYTYNTYIMYIIIYNTYVCWDVHQQFCDICTNTGIRMIWYDMIWYDMIWHVYIYIITLYL